MAHTTARATTLLRSHPTLLTTVKKTIANVVENGDNRDALKWARFLLERFPAEVQHAAANPQLQTAEKPGASLAANASAPSTASLTLTVATLTTSLASSNAEIESLLALLADSADGVELAALAKGAKAADDARRVSLVAVKVEGEKRAGKRARK